MSKIIINPCGSLNGEVTVSGSKNSALPILAASILTDGKNVFRNIPELSDIDHMCEILSELNLKITKIGICLMISVKNFQGKMISGMQQTEK